MSIDIPEPVTLMPVNAYLPDRDNRRELPQGSAAERIVIRVLELIAQTHLSKLTAGAELV